MLEPLTAIRYVTPLKEGGSLPAVVEADDGGLYVMKFTGAGQGARALVAEVIGGAVALALGLSVPRMVLLELDPSLAANEPNGEIRDLLRASAGANLGFHYLEGAFAYNPLVQPPPSAALASSIVWFDAYITNVDRTARNVNLLLAEQRLWLIDHGASLYFHHLWDDIDARSLTRFPLVKDHVLLPYASEVTAADAAARALLTDEVLHAAVDAVPEAWLLQDRRPLSPDAQRAGYRQFLTQRRDHAELFVEEALLARSQQL